MNIIKPVLPSVKLYVAKNRSEAIVSLQGMDNYDKVLTIKATIEVIDTEAEMLIAQGAHDIAIIKMSQVVMLEEVLMTIERVVMKEASM